MGLLSFGTGWDYGKRNQWETDILLGFIPKYSAKKTKVGADYIKTSTGFGGAGATFADIELFSRHIGPNVKMKAAGGISSLEDAEKFLALGADRLGTSRIIKIVKNEKATGY